MSTIGRLCIIMLLTGSVLAQCSPPPALYGTDALGRDVPGPSDVREFRSDRYVGIFYFLWLDLNQVYDNSQIMAEHPNARATSASPPWGPVHAYHFWGQPLYGYYRSDDPWVLRRHAALLSDAGVDFLIFDTTNAAIYEKAFMQLCEVFDEQRRLGERVPQIAFMVNTQAGQTAQRIYEKLYKPGLYPELWFRWQGKPLMLCDPAQAPEEVARFFTLRKAHWPFELVNTHNAWHWEATYPQPYSYDRDPSHAEEVNVSVGQNLNEKTGKVEMMSTGHARGRSYHNGHRDTRPEAYKYGFNFQEQWQRAFELDPNVVFITGWNEWIAMQLNKDKGPAIFCDQFSLEFSRDVEMMKGGYGDDYYLQMASNIRRFKGMRPAVKTSGTKSIDIAGPMSQWDDVEATYRDHAGDTLPRDFRGCGDKRYTVTTGRNDFRVLKVTQDQRNVYFYAQTTDPITSCTDPNWMWLMIDIKGTDAANWEDFNFLVNRQPSDRNSTSLEACLGGWTWQRLATISYRVQDNRMHLAIPKNLLGITGDNVTIEFKWIDNTQSPGDILDLYTNGDTAPNGRFRYRYRYRTGISRLD